MRPIIYLILFAIAFLVFKAMYLDSYTKESDMDNNASLFSESCVVDETADAEPETKKDTNLSTREQFRKETEQSYLDEGVDWLGNKLEEKLK